MKLFKEYLKMFKDIDVDGSKSLDRDELKEAFSKLLEREPSKSEMKHMMTEIDKDGDGNIEFHEFFRESLFMSHYYWFIVMIYANAQADQEREILVAAFRDFDAIYTDEIMKRMRIESKDPEYKMIRGFIPVSKVKHILISFEG